MSNKEEIEAILFPDGYDERGILKLTRDNYRGMMAMCYIGFAIMRKVKRLQDDKTGDKNP